MHVFGAMVAAHPVSVSVGPPQQWSRAQLALRVVLFLLFGLTGLSIGAVFLALYLGLPAFTAIAVSNDGAEGFRARTVPSMVSALRWIAAVHAYFALLTDRLPTHDAGAEVVLDVAPSGAPTVGSALLRIVFGIPSAVVLAIVMIFSAIAWVIAFVQVLFTRRYWRGLFDFQLGVLRWTARLFAYQASVVEEYPPFALGDAAHGDSMHTAGQF